MLFICTHHGPDSNIMICNKYSNRKNTTEAKMKASYKFFMLVVENLQKESSLSFFKRVQGDRILKMHWSAFCELIIHYIYSTLHGESNDNISSDIIKNEIKEDYYLKIISCKKISCCPHARFRKCTAVAN